MIKRTILSLFFCINLYANSYDDTIYLQKDFQVSLPWLEQKPKSYAKDFFIIQYLKRDDISLEDATTAYNMAQKKNSRVKKLFNKKYRIFTAFEKKCYRTPTAELLKESSKCIALGLNIKEATKLSKSRLKEFIGKLDAYPTLRDDLKVLASDDVFKALQNSNFNRFFRLFFKVGKDYRIEHFDRFLSNSFLDKLSLQKKFELFVRYTIFDKNKYKNIQKSLLYTISNPKMSYEVEFLLGINAINNKKDKIAYNFFKNSYEKAYLRSKKDRALFWLYKITNNKTFLNELSASWDNNIYSLYAKEIYGIQSDNIIYNIKVPNLKTNYNIYDQFSWIKVLDDTKTNLDDKKLLNYKSIFTSKDTIPQLAFVLQRYYKYKKQYFIMPYRDILQNYDINKQILIYSIARQESRFIPSSISSSTAQGIMQIMPFLSKDIAKKLKEPYNIYEQFVPKTNLKFASYHLDSLKKQFNNNPLFIAYAYNGGAGYTRSQFKKGLFKSREKYEPFLSMEMISYPETRNYGKKVLANYYIYNNYLNPKNKITLSTIFQSLLVTK